MCCFQCGVGSDTGLLSARIHARIDAGMLVVKAILCLCFQLAEVGIIHRTVLVVLLCCASAVYVYGYYAYQPYVDLRVNQAFVGGAALFAWATFCLLLQIVRNHPAVRAVSHVFLKCVRFAGLHVQRHRALMFRCSCLCLFGLNGMLMPISCYSIVSGMNSFMLLSVLRCCRPMWKLSCLCSERQASPSQLHRSHGVIFYRWTSLWSTVVAHSWCVFVLFRVGA